MIYSKKDENHSRRSVGTMAAKIQGHSLTQHTKAKLIQKLTAVGRKNETGFSRLSQ